MHTTFKNINICVILLYRKKVFVLKVSYAKLFDILK